MRRSSTTPFRSWIKALTGALTVLLVVVWEHVEAARLEKQLRGMRKERDQLIYEDARLQAQINQWMSPSNLDKIARTQLHMTPVDPRRVIGVEIGKK